MKSLQLFCSGSTVLTFGESAGSCWLWRMMLTAWAFQGNKTGPLQGSQASEMWEVTAAPGLGQIYRRNAHTSTQLISPGDMEPLALCPGGSTVLTELGCSQLRAYLRISVQPCVVWSRHSHNIGFWLGWFFFFIWNLRFLVTAAQTLRKTPAIVWIAVKASELAWVDLLHSACIDLQQISLPWLHREGNPPGGQDGILFHACYSELCKKLDPRRAAALTLFFASSLLFAELDTPFSCFSSPGWLRCLFLHWERRTELPVRCVHGRQMGKQCSLWNSTLASLELLGLLDSLGFSSKKLKKTSDFIQVWLFILGIASLFILEENWYSYTIFFFHQVRPYESITHYKSWQYHTGCEVPKGVSNGEVALCGVPILNWLGDFVWFRATSSVIVDNSGWVQALRIFQEIFG